MMEEINAIIYESLADAAKIGETERNGIRELAEEIGRQIVKILIESGILDQR